MEIPILQVGKILIVSIQTEIDDREVLALQDKLLKKLKVTASQGIIIDLSAVEIVDSFMCRTLHDIGKMAHLMGAKVVNTGITAPVAIAMTELGIDSNTIMTKLSLDKGISYLESLVENKC